MDERIIVKKLEIVRALAVEQSVGIASWEARTAEHLGPDDYKYLDDWHAVPQLSRWPAGVTVFLRTEVTVPEGWDPRRTMLNFGFEALEGLLRVDGAPWSGIDSNHARCPVPRDGTLALTLEFDSVPRARCEPHLQGSTGTFTGGSLQLIDPQVEAAYYDLRFVFEACSAIEDGRRRELLEAALEDAMVAFTVSAPREVILAELAEARALLAHRIAAIAPDAEGGRLLLTGHTHIDTAWLWPLKESIRKCGRTFSTAAWMMDRYPDYHFSCSQAQLYEYTKLHYPEVYAKIRRLVAEGRWENTGAMWVEADCNVSSGESLIRQMLYGLRFFKEEFGTRPTVCWLPDVFGYNAGLPQILAGCGVQSFWTWKLHWQSRNPFPYHLFWWQGVDGSRVLAHIPRLGGGAYNGDPTPQQLATSWQTYVQKGTYDQQLFPFGYGDGGGGVTEMMMEYAGRAASFPGLPQCSQGTSEDFFEEVRAAGPDLPTWVGELYLETHRGTYTSQARTKRNNRHCEMSLRGTEMLAVVARRLRTPVDVEPLRRAWKKVLLHQFHDILPGSSIGEVYDDATRDYEEVLATSAAVREVALKPILGKADDTLRYGILNSLSWERNGVVELDIPDVGDELVGSMGGLPVPVQIVSRSGDRMRVLVAAEKVPPLGGALLDLQMDRPLPSLITATDRCLENQFFRIELNDDGEISSLYDKRCGREVVAEGQTLNQLQLFQDGPEREAAWNIHATYNKRRYPWEGECSLQATESGPVRATVRLTRRHRDTTLVQDITVYDHKPRIDFRTRVDWQERQTMLKAAFPVAVHTPKASFEVQFGVVERPTHRNTSWEQEQFEVCAQRWADLSEGGYGVSLLNDGRYGHDVLGNVLRLTLLRGPQYPDPECDLGAHQFTYSLLPHDGDWRQGGTVLQAWQLNSPLLAVPTDIQREPTSLIEVEGPAIVEALKPAEDGNGDILRVYEPYGGRGLVTIAVRIPVSRIVACNLVEEDEEELPLCGEHFSFPIKPFEVRSFRLL